MPLNPAYVQQDTRPLPFCVGHVYVQGDKVNSIVGFDGSTVEQYLLGEGEWESNEFISLQPTDRFMTGTLVGGSYGYGLKGAQLNQTTLADRLYYYHFHGGSFSPIGMPLNLISLGPDQGSETWLQYFPSVTPALCYSGKAYYIIRRNVTNLGSVAMNPVGIYKSLRCRQFDAAGEVTQYSFTTNPTWQMIECLLRYQIKPQQPGLMGLTAAEKACFDWPAMVAHAARNATILANGAPQFTGNFAFAADATLASMMETMLRNCRSFKRVRGSQIAFVGDDPRASVFTFSQRNLVPGSVKIDKKDLSTAPNVYIPQYRDVAIPAIAQLASIAANTSGGGSVFTTVGQQPFAGLDIVTASGTSNDAAFAGEYQVQYYADSNGNAIAPPIANKFNAVNAPAAGGTATGGYLGTQQSRFSQRAPTVVQHRAHQRLVGVVSPGITPLPRTTPVFYDLGNNTFDQTNRIMQYMCAKELGSDGVNWKAPFKGTLSGFMDAVDANGVALLQIEEGDVITLDDTAAPDFPGDYEVVGPITRNPALYNGEGSTIDLTVQTYNPAAFPNISYPPGDSYQTLPGSLLPMADVIPAAIPFWLIRATPTATLDSGGSTLTLTIPDLLILWMGQPVATVYPAISQAGCPVGTHFIVYMTVTNMATNPTLKLDTTAANPPAPLGQGVIVIYAGKIAAAAAGSGSNSKAQGGNSGNPYSSGGVTYSPDPGGYGGQPIDQNGDQVN